MEEILLGLGYYQGKIVELAINNPNSQDLLKIIECAKLLLKKNGVNVETKI